MKQIIGAFVSHHTLADITLKDPPMEQIIAEIYGQAAGAGGKRQRAESSAEQSEPALSSVPEVV
jgi:hypothetical protein